MIYDSLVAVVKPWRRTTCPLTSPLNSAHLHSTLGPEPTAEVSCRDTEDRGRDRDKQRVCEIYLQPLGYWPECCCYNILNLTGKA